MAFGFGKRGFRRLAGVSGLQRRASKAAGVKLGKAGKGCGCAVLLAFLGAGAAAGIGAGVVWWLLA